MTRPLPGCPAERQDSRYIAMSSFSAPPAIGMAMIEWPALPAPVKLSGVAMAATQMGGRGFCTQRGSEVTFLN